MSVLKRFFSKVRITHNVPRSFYLVQYREGILWFLSDWRDDYRYNYWTQESGGASHGRPLSQEQAYNHAVDRAECIANTYIIWEK